MKFRKVKDGVGDYIDVDFSLLHAEIKAVIHPDCLGDWGLIGDENHIDVIIRNDLIDQDAVRDVVLLHGSEANVLERYKQKKCKDFNALKVAEEDNIASVEHNGKYFQADEASQKRMTSVVTAFQSTGLPDGFTWRAEDNTDVAVSIADLITIGQKIAGAAYAVHLKARAKKDAVMACNTIEEVDAITWE